jgi:cell division septal protein FtsQ
MSLDPRFLRPGYGVERSGLHKRRRFRIVFAAAVMLVAAAVVLSVMAYRFITNPDRFHVRQIIVQGAEFADREEIEARVRELTDSNVLLVDLEEVCRAVEQLPWVEKAKARKVLPDTLQIAVVERLPVVYVVLGDRIYLADESGILIDEWRPEHPFIGPPVVRGFDGLSREETRERVRLAAVLLKELRQRRPEWYDRISEVLADQPRRLTVLLRDTDTPIIVGDTEITERLEKYFSIEEELKRRYDTLEYIDVRFDRRLYAKPVGRVHDGQAP